MRRGEIHELIRELNKYAIKYRVEKYHVNLSGGYESARKHYEDLIAGDEEVEAMLILEYSKQDADLRYEIEERACIMSEINSDRYDLLEAVKVHMRVARMNEEWEARRNEAEG